MYDIQHFHESRISPMTATFWEGGTREMKDSLKEQNPPNTRVAVCPLAMLLAPLPTSVNTLKQVRRTTTPMTSATQQQLVC